MIDTQWMLDDIDNDIRPDFSDLSKYDRNGDGELTSDDCPFEPGSGKAQLWFSKVLQPYVKQQVSQEIMEKFPDQTVVGVYKGKALIPGDPDNPNGKLDYVVDRLKVTKGMSTQGAERVAKLVRNPVFMVDIPK